MTNERRPRQRAVRRRPGALGYGMCATLLLALACRITLKWCADPSGRTGAARSAAADKGRLSRFDDREADVTAQ